MIQFNNMLRFISRTINIQEFIALGWNWVSLGNLICTATGGSVLNYCFELEIDDKNLKNESEQCRF